MFTDDTSPLKIDNQYLLLCHILYLRKVASIKSSCLPSILVRPLGLYTQAFQLGILITFVLLFILIISVDSCNVCKFNFYIFSKKVDFFEATCFIIQLLNF
jgi:hypothetical protein